MSFTLHVIIPASVVINMSIDIAKITSFVYIYRYLIPILSQYHIDQKVKLNIHTTKSELDTNYLNYCQNQSSPMTFLKFALNYLHQIDPNGDGNRYEVDEQGHIWNLTKSTNAKLSNYGICDVIPMTKNININHLIDINRHWIDFENDCSEQIQTNKENIINNHIDDYVVVLDCY